jgi:LmbE family N-acetylglucosaminyl deacetylase
MKRPLVILILLLLSAAALLPASRGVATSSLIIDRAALDAVEERGVVALHQALRELSNPYSVMSVAAHVSDVDWGTLAYYHKKLGARALLVLATSIDEPAVNPMHGSAEGAGAVAIRRTLETARITGCDVYFLNLPEKGTAKSSDELLNLWGQNEAVGQLVRAFRLLRPDAVLTNHSSADDRAHLAVWRLVSEAFEAAADSNRFPDPGSKPWQVRRVFQKTDELNADVAVNAAEFDHVRGLRYNQIGVSDQSASTSGRLFYKLARSARGEKLKPGASLLDDLPLPENLTRSIAPPVVGDKTMAESINQRESLADALIEKLVEKRTEGSPEELFERYGPEFFRILRFRETLERTIALALGLDFRITAADRAIVPGQKLVARLVLSNRGSRVLPVVFHTAESPPEIGKTSPSVTSEVVTLSAGSIVTRDLQYDLRPDSKLTVPHSSAHLANRYYYALGSALPGFQSTNPFGNELVAYADVSVGHTSIVLPALVRYDIVPPIEIRIKPSFALVRDWNTPREMEFIVTLRNRTPGRLEGALWVVPVAIADASYEPAHIQFAVEDEVIRVGLKIKLPILKPPLAPDVLIEFRRENTAGEPLTSTKIAVTSAEFELVPGTTVGFIHGAGPESDLPLAQLGVTVSEIPLDSLRRHHPGDRKESRTGCSDLSHFDSIVIDSFIYLSESDPISTSTCLFEYVRKGGNLIVLGGPASDDSVSRRSLPDPSHGHASPTMNVVLKEHSLLSKPNRVTDKDFEAWRPAEGLQTIEWPGDHIPIVEVSDATGQAKRPVLLFGRVGEGTYTYSGLNLAEQISVGNPVAYRLLGNMLAASKSRKQRWYDEW